MRREAFKGARIRSLPRFVFFFLLAVSFGCTTKSGPQTRNEKPNPYEGLFTEKCTGCHDLTLVEEAHRTKTNAEMKEILKGHKDKKGSEITEQDLKALLRLY